MILTDTANKKRNLILSKWLTHIKEASAENNGKMPYGIVSKLVRDNSDVAPWLIRDIISHHLKKDKNAYSIKTSLLPVAVSPPLRWFSLSHPWQHTSVCLPWKWYSLQYLCQSFSLFPHCQRLSLCLPCKWHSLKLLWSPSPYSPFWWKWQWKWRRRKPSTFPSSLRKFWSAEGIHLQQEKMNQYCTICRQKSDSRHLLSWRKEGKA